MPHTSKPNQTSFLTYALNEKGNLVHVDSVPNGNECGCVCPCCECSLCAKNGGHEREHHFAHLGGADCVGGVESALHIMAKEVFQRRKCVRLPAIKDVCNSELLHLDEVDVEVRDDSTFLRPDCIGRYRDKTIWIEFKRTHAVDQKKKEKIVSRRVDCLEIDLNGCELDPKQVEDLLINEQGHRVWIFNPAIDAAMAEAAERRAREEEARMAMMIEADERRAKEEEARMAELREAEERWLSEAMNDPRYFLVVDNHKNPVVRNFALTDENKVFDLRTCDTAEDSTHRYYCPSCGREVRFYDSSNKRLRHFVHIDNKCSNCTDERYLVRTAQASSDGVTQLYLVNFGLNEDQYDDAVALGLIHCHKKGLNACCCPICSRNQNCNMIDHHPVECPRFVLNNLLESELKETYAFVRIVE